MTTITVFVQAFSASPRPRQALCQSQVPPGVSWLGDLRECLLQRSSEDSLYECLFLDIIWWSNFLLHVLPPASCLRWTTSGLSITCLLPCSFSSSSVLWLLISLMKEGKEDKDYHLLKTWFFTFKLSSKCLVCFIFCTLIPGWCWTSTCLSMRLDRSLWWCARGSACSSLCWWFLTLCSTCGLRPSQGVTATLGCAVFSLPPSTCSTNCLLRGSCLLMLWWPTVCHLLPASSSSWNRSVTRST